MPISLEIETCGSRESAKYVLREARGAPLGRMSLEQLFTQARNERDGVPYMAGGYYETDPYNQQDPTGQFYVEQEKTHFVDKYSQKRYREICEVIAVKVIYCDEKDVKVFKENCEDDPADVKTQADVYEIIKDKYKKSSQDVDELEKSYKGKDETENLVTPLRNALYSHVGTSESLPGYLSPAGMLTDLRNFKDALLNTEKGQPSIAQQLKDTDDSVILKALKSILSTLATAIMGSGPHAIWGLDSAGEQLAKNAERRLFPERHQSIHHIKEGKVQAAENQKGEAPDPSNKAGDPTPPSSSSPSPKV